MVILIFTGNARDGTLSKRVKDATLGVAAVGALPLGFQVKLGLVRGKCLPVGLHTAEASYVSASSLSLFFRAAIVRSVWSSKMPLASTLVIPSLLDGPVGVDHAFHFICARFRMMRRYLAYCPLVFSGCWILSLVGLRGMDRSICCSPLLLSWVSLGMDERGWVRASLLPLGMMTGPVQHIFSSILEAWLFRSSSQFAERQGFRGAEVVDFGGLFSTT